MNKITHFSQITNQFAHQAVQKMKAHKTFSIMVGGFLLSTIGFGGLTQLPVRALERDTATTTVNYTVRTANVTGKHMDGFTGNGYNKRPYYGTWDERKPILMSDISQNRPSVLGLQEVDAGTQSDYIYSKLVSYGYATTSNHSTNSRPIYWTKSKFSLIKTATFSLGDADGRRATYVILKDVTTNQQIIFINAHYESSLDTAGDKARMQSAVTVAVLADSLSQDGLIPVIFMGDHNSNKYTNPYYITTGQCTYAKRSNGCYSKAKSYGLASKITAITPLADATNSTTNRVNYQYDTNNGYYKYDCSGSTKSHCSHRVIDHVYLDRVNADGTIKMDVTKVWNDIPSTRTTSAHGTIRSTDHNPQTAYITMSITKPVAPTTP
jgi:endonuclease/exonuclease/phosphatase family metal-dependent hydrolase